MDFVEKKRKAENGKEIKKPDFDSMNEEEFQEYVTEAYIKGLERKSVERKLFSLQHLSEISCTLDTSVMKIHLILNALRVPLIIIRDHGKKIGIITRDDLFIYVAERYKSSRLVLRLLFGKPKS